MLRSIVALALVAFSSICLLAQSPQADTAFLTSSIQSAKDLYTKKFSKQSHLLNGSDYVDYQPLDDEHPFFLSDDWEMGVVDYDGETFTKVPLIYDIEKDKLITEYIHNGGMMQLVQEKVKSFSFAGHHFVRLTPNEKDSPISPGYYELLYDGPTKVYEQYKKTFRERIVSQEYEKLFDQRSRYFIFKDGHYYPVDKKSSVLKVFENKKQALKQALKKNNVKFGKDRATGIVEAAQVYDSLN